MLRKATHAPDAAAAARVASHLSVKSPDLADNVVENLLSVNVVLN
jgi:hypothetical protein